ncbi:hypothetical protein [Prevotella fusca]
MITIRGNKSWYKTAFHSQVSRKRDFYSRNSTSFSSYSAAWYGMMMKQGVGPHLAMKSHW